MWPRSRGTIRVEGELHAEDHAVEVDVDHPPRGQVVLVDEAADLHDPRVVDEHVDRPELLLGARRGTPRRSRGRSRRAAARPSLAAELRRRSARAASTSRSPIATFMPWRRNACGGRPPDPAGGACDRGGLAGEDAGLLGHRLSLLCWLARWRRRNAIARAASAAGAAAGQAARPVVGWRDALLQARRTAARLHRVRRRAGRADRGRDARAHGPQRARRPGGR